MRNVLLFIVLTLSLQVQGVIRNCWLLGQNQAHRVHLGDRSEWNLTRYQRDLVNFVINPFRHFGKSDPQGHFGLNFGVIFKATETLPLNIARSKRLGRKGMSKLIGRFDNQEKILLIDMGAEGWDGNAFNSPINNYSRRSKTRYRYSQEELQYAKENPDQFTYLNVGTLKEEELGVEFRPFFHPDALSKAFTVKSSSGKLIEFGGDQDIIKTLSLILGSGYKNIVFHCHSGRHRTGMIAMLIRALQGGNWLKPFAEPFYIQGIPIHNLAEAEYVFYNPNALRESNLIWFYNFIRSDAFHFLKEEYGNLFADTL